MSATVCLVPVDTLGYLHGGGGHLWAYLSWALGLRALGCPVIWLEWVDSRSAAAEMHGMALELRVLLQRHGITLAVAIGDGEPPPPSLAAVCPGLEAATEADLLLNFRYGLAAHVVRQFRRSALVDIDPGLLQVWMHEGQLDVAAHDRYFTIGETVGRPDARIPDTGHAWRYTPRPMFLAAWPPVPAPAGAPYTTVSNWWGEWLKLGNELLPNDKRTSFFDIADVPARVKVPLELALTLADGDTMDRAMLEGKGWRVRRAWDVSATADDYRTYIQTSRGEFSAAKPSCMRLANAWISDRTLCYLASGKPAIVQHTGASAILPDAEGLLRFRDADEAVRHLEAAEEDYDRHARAARALVEEHFDAVRVMAGVLEHGLD
jgi:hypothetical protein